MQLSVFVYCLNQFKSTLRIGCSSECVAFISLVMNQKKKTRILPGFYGGVMTNYNFIWPASITKYPNLMLLRAIVVVNSPVDVLSTSGFEFCKNFKSTSHGHSV